MKITRQQSMQLQRLVDGELDFAEIQQLMQSAENKPELWRQIASAFVEDQLWLAQFADHAGMPAMQVVAPVKPEPPPKAGVPGQANGVRWWSIAAMLALALTVGFLSGRGDFAQRAPLSDPVTADRKWVDPGSPSAPMALAQHDNRAPASQINPAFYHMQLEDPQGNRYLDSEIPLYSVTQSTDLRRLDAGEIPPVVQEQARNSGYQVHQDIRYVSGQLNDGRRFIIPIRNYRFSPNQ